MKFQNNDDARKPRAGARISGDGGGRYPGDPHALHYRVQYYNYAFIERVAHQSRRSPPNSRVGGPRRRRAPTNVFLLLESRPYRNHRRVRRRHRHTLIFNNAFININITVSLYVERSWLLTIGRWVRFDITRTTPSHDNAKASPDSDTVLTVRATAFRNGNFFSSTAKDS